MRLPWTDRTGRLVPLKLVVFVALLPPGLWIAYALATGQFGGQPLKAATREMGSWALRFLLLSLAVTPLRALWKWNGLIAVRRMLGVGAFVYGAAHLALYAASQGWDLGKVAAEIVLRVYLTIGFVASVAMAALAATSTDGAMRRIGGKAWRNLHRLAYPIALLAIVHFFLQARLGAIEPQIVAGLFVWAMAWRAAPGKGPGTALALGLAAAMLVVGAETAFFAIRYGAPADILLAANLDPDMAPRPVHVVLGFVAAIAAVAFVRARP
ncbi:MAG: sulfoxide reductase heme-binding subunit YedZ [Azospirillum sp.]|nr:sulfoxide reductase heme-binding subunit YedZ [Azospirillum sp.]